MEGTVGVTCPDCSTNIIVLPAGLFKVIGDAYGVEAETQFHDAVSGSVAKTGARLVIADVDRGYTCPVCGERGRLPPEEELPRLKGHGGGP